MKSKQIIAISLYDMLTIYSMHVHTTMRFTENDIKVIRDLDGVTNVEVHNYTIDVNFGHAFDFNTLAAKVLKEILGLLEIGIDDVEFKTDDIIRKDEKAENLLAIVAIIRGLETMTAPKNPIAPFVATLDDIKDGVELLEVSFGRKNSYQTSTVVGPVSQVNTIATTGPRGPLIKNLAKIGVTKSFDIRETWSDTALTIVNTQANRRLLVKWLLKLDQSFALQIAQEIVNDYLVDFVKVDIADDGYAYVLRPVVTL